MFLEVERLVLYNGTLNKPTGDVKAPGCRTHVSYGGKQFLHPKRPQQSTSTTMDSVKSVLRIIEAVAHSPEIGVSDLARQLQQPKTTVQRGLMTLHEAGWIKPTNEPRRRWKITSKLFMLSRSAETEVRLRRAALPVMQTLRDETQETTHLMVREERHIVLIERVDSPLSLRTVRDLGSRSPLHTSANGKAYLAFLPAREQEDYLSGKLTQLTENSKTDPDTIRRDLAQIRKLGYATNVGEVDLHVHAVAAPVMNPEGRPIAAMAISCPSSRLPIEKMPFYGEKIIDAARQISERLAG
jgi:IclR family acetate operon transcriptional repressor